MAMVLIADAKATIACGAVKQLGLMTTSAANVQLDMMAIGAFQRNGLELLPASRHSGEDSRAGFPWYSDTSHFRIPQASQLLRALNTSAGQSRLPAGGRRFPPLPGSKSVILERRLGLDYRQTFPSPADCYRGKTIGPPLFAQHPPTTFTMYVNSRQSGEVFAPGKADHQQDPRIFQTGSTLRPVGKRHRKFPSTGAPVRFGNS